MSYAPKAMVSLTLNGVRFEVMPTEGRRRSRKVCILLDSRPDLPCDVLTFAQPAVRDNTGGVDVVARTATAPVEWVEAHGALKGNLLSMSVGAENGSTEGRPGGIYTVRRRIADTDEIAAELEFDMKNSPCRLFMVNHLDCGITVSPREGINAAGRLVQFFLAKQGRNPASGNSYPHLE